MDPLNQHHISLMGRLRRTRHGAFAVLLAENFSGAFWRIIVWFCLFAGIWMLQIPQFFGVAGPAVALALFLAGLGYYGWRDARTFRLPNRFAIDRRLEQAGHIRHRPLAALEDKLSAARQPETVALWKLNQENAIGHIGKLRLPRPRPVLAALDRNAFRMLAILIAVVGFIFAGPQALPRVKQGMFPYIFRHQETAASDISLRITPPAYTRQQTIVIQDGRLDKPLQIPEGSMLKAHAGPGWGTPDLTMGKTSRTFRRLENGNWTLETVVTPGDRIVVHRLFMKRADIAYDYVIDRKPEIAVKGGPEKLPKGQWQFDTTLKDDYGVTSLILHMSLDPQTKDAPLGKPVNDSRPVMTQPGTATAMKPVYDMTWHNWAGLPVIVTLEARDHKGQSAVTPPMKLTLPERPFRHPVAQAIIGLRKRLAWTPEASALNVAFSLQDILGKPDCYQGDIVVFLTLRAAASRLMYDPAVKTAEAVIPLLWDIALKIEDGDVSIAARNFREAQQELQKLLNDPKATPEQIATAMEKLRQTMAQYLMESFREMQKRIAENGIEPMSPDELTKIMKPEDIQAFLDQLQAQALTGDKDAARKMLEQLENLTNMMDPSMAKEMPKDMQQMQKAYQELRKLKDEQQALMEQTKKKQSQQKGNGSCKNEGDAQESLQGRLEQIMPEVDEATGSIPQSMQDADKGMRESATALRKDDAQGSLPHQQTVIDKLQQGQQEMSEKMKERMKQMMMMAFGSGNTDPMGRPQDGPGQSMFSGSTVKIPDEAERRRVQEILKTLRQRSGELNRPDYELEYYRRLMRQF